MTNIFFESMVNKYVTQILIPKPEDEKYILRIYGKYRREEREIGQRRGGRAKNGAERKKEGREE